MSQPALRTANARPRPSSRQVVVTVSAEGVRSPVAATLLAEAVRMVCRAENVCDGMLSVALVSGRRMAAMNLRHLGHRGATDVIAFGLAGVPRSRVVGDVYIAPAVARANARRLGRSIREEVVRLVVHGVLHVLGYDHPVDGSRERSAMWRRQEMLVRRALLAGAT